MLIQIEINRRLILHIYYNVSNKNSGKELYFLSTTKLNYIAGHLINIANERIISTESLKELNTYLEPINFYSMKN